MSSIDLYDKTQIDLAKKYFSKKLSKEYLLFLLNTRKKTTLQKWAWNKIKTEQTNYYNFLYNEIN